MAAYKCVDTNAYFAGVSILPQNALTALVSRILHLYERALVEVSRGIGRYRIQMHNDQCRLLWCKTKGKYLIREQSTPSVLQEQLRSALPLGTREQSYFA